MQMYIKMLVQNELTLMNIILKTDLCVCKLAARDPAVPSHIYLIVLKQNDYYHGLQLLICLVELLDWLTVTRLNINHKYP